MSSKPLWDLYHTEFHADSESGLQIDLRGRTSEHKRFFRISFLIRRYNLFRAIAQNLIIVYADFWHQISTFLWYINLLKLLQDGEVLGITKKIRISWKYVDFFFCNNEIELFSIGCRNNNKSMKWRIIKQLSHNIFDFDKTTSKKWNRNSWNLLKMRPDIL